MPPTTLSPPQPVDPLVCRQAVHDAFNAGVNFFDTSPFYGATKSETVLGAALQGLPRSQVVISTKVGQTMYSHTLSTTRFSAAGWAVR